MRIFTTPIIKQPFSGSASFVEKVLLQPLGGVKQRRNSSSRASPPFCFARCLHHSSTSDDDADGEDVGASSSSSSSSLLSSRRGRDAVALLPSYLSDARAVTRYDAIHHPDGALQLGVAESQMLEDWLVPALNYNYSSQITADCIYYQPTAGREDLRMAMSNYIEDLVGLETGRLSSRIHDDGAGGGCLVVGAGCNAVLENLCFCLTEPGDSVLIPTPYYAAFEFDLVARAGLNIEPVTTMDYHHHATETTIISSDSSPTTIGDAAAAEIYYPNTAALDAAYQRSMAAGHDPRILLISHPQNPLGICYPSHVMKECIDWCRSRQVHLISDEIYAGSIHAGPDQSGFESILTLADNDNDNDNNNGLGPFVHWVYALSKDFALSGLRVGAVYTENEEISLPLQKLNDLCQISSTTQVWTAATLTRHHDGKEDDELWVEAFRRENHRRLSERREALTACLRECDISFLEPTAGLFVWIDLSKYLPNDLSTPEERERALYLELVNEFGLLLTPGLSMRNERPGFFRCVFTAASDEEFALSLDRFRKFAANKQSS